VDGKHLSDHFSDAPFGWSPDTLRYLVAAMLVNGEIKLKISGREIKVNGQQAIEALRTNNTFKNVGVSLREAPPPVELLARAATRLTEIVGENVIPLEQEISKIASKQFPQFQQQYGPLEEKLKNLGLPGDEKVHELNHDIAEILETDGSDLPQRLGSPESTLYSSLKWAAEVNRALKNGLEKTIQELREHWREIKALPDSGTPGKLKTDVEESLELIAERLEQDNFYEHAADLKTSLTDIKTMVRLSIRQMMEDQKETIQNAGQELQKLNEWPELTQEEQSNTLAELEGLSLEVDEDLQGLRKSLGQEYTIQYELNVLKRKISELVHKRIIDVPNPEKFTGILKVPRQITTGEQLETLIQQLQTLKSKIALHTKIEVSTELED
jgi:hypothetical protein